MTPVAASLIILAHSMVGTYMGVDPDAVPPINGAYTLPYTEVDSKCQSGCVRGSTAVYIARDKTIYIGLKSHYKDKFIFSQLLHENVHHFQREANINRANLNCEEFEAQTLQAIYLKGEGEQWIDKAFVELKNNRKKCSRFRFK